MRRAWRKSKREHTVILPNGRSVSVGSNSPNQRHNNESDSSDSDLDRRNNITSMMPIPEGESMFYAPAYVYEDSRPTTSSSVVSSAADDRRSYVPPQYPHTMHPGSITARRPSAPGYLPMPPQMPQNFRHTPSGYPTPTQQNPFPMSMRQDYPFQTLTSPMPMVMGVGSAHHFDSQFAFQG